MAFDGLVLPIPTEQQKIIVGHGQTAQKSLTLTGKPISQTQISLLVLGIMALLAIGTTRMLVIQ